MQLTISKSVLRPAVLRASATADGKQASGVCAFARLRANGKTLSITSTDLRVTAISVLPASVEKPGSVLVDADRLAGVIAKAPGDEVSISLDDKMLTIKSGKSRVQLLCQPDRDYPAVPDIDRATLAPCSPTLLAGMLAKTMPAMCLDENRVSYFGVAFRIGNASAGGSRMAGTDGKRLAVAVADLALPEHAEVIIPAGGAKAIHDLVRDAEECELGFTGSYVMVRTGVTTMAVKLADATFVPYQQAVATLKHKTRTIVEKKSMLDALDRAAFMTEKDDGDKTHGIVIEVGAGLLVIDARHPDHGNAHEEVDADITGKSIRFGVHPKFLRDALRAVDNEHAAIETDGPLDHIVVRSSVEGESLSAIAAMRLE